jgi:hypothetical protein
LSGSDDSAKRETTAQRLLSWVAVAVAVVVFGFLAVRLYIHYTQPEPAAPVPIRIFRTPTNNDYSSIAANELV